MAAAGSLNEKQRRFGMTLRVLIVDDNEVTRRGIRALLGHHPELQVCGEAADGREGAEKARELKADVALLDVSMPIMNGLDAARQIRREMPDCKILIVSQNNHALMEKLAKEAGADAFVHKSEVSRKLVGAIEGVVRNGGGADSDLAKLRLDAELLAAIVASSDDAIVSKNLDGTITSWNRSAERIFGYTMEEAIGQPITLIVPQDRLDEEAEILARLRKGERVDHFHTIRRCKDGTTIDVSLTISPVKDASGRIVGASKVARDITKQLRDEEALRQSEDRYRKLSETLDVEVRERTKELEARTADVLEQAEHVRDLSRRLLQTQDDERRHIARELHDSAGQTMTVLAMNLAQLVAQTREVAPQVAERAARSQELVQQLNQEIRTTSYLLHPPMLDEVGLAAAVGWYIEGLRERSGVDITLSISEEFERLAPEIELVIFRLLQECLTNVHRHSGSKTAAVRIAREGDAIALEVRDQGQGMSAKKLAEIQSAASGVGVRGMRERVRQFEGSLNIESGNCGTRVFVTIPIGAACLRK
jgi:PAS domain S-box-containing protein